MTKQIRVSRRQILRGAGGASLSLPFLPSLVPAPAHANVTFEIAPNFAAITSIHGGVENGNMLPDEGWLSEERDLYEGHKVRQGDLRMQKKLSNTLDADELNTSLINKVNVITGLDVAHYGGHHSGHLGNYAERTQVPKDVLNPVVSIDQIMAYSGNFYRTSPRVRTMNFSGDSAGENPSFTYENPSTKQGVEQTGTDSEENLFQRLFDAGAPDRPTPPEASGPRRPPVVDRLLESYNSLRQSNRRLSAADRMRLDAHVARLADLQSRLSPGNSGPQIAPGECNIRDTNNRLDIIAMAFACGVSQIAIVGEGGADHDSAHDHIQKDLYEHDRGIFRQFTALADKLDQIPAGEDGTVLDSSLVMWINEAGPETHCGQEQRIITAGSAGRQWNTGKFIDFRNLEKTIQLLVPRQRHATGLTVRQFFANTMMAMGINKSEFEKDGLTGYGDPYVDEKYRDKVHPNVLSNASDKLPFLWRS